MSEADEILDWAAENEPEGMARRFKALLTERDQLRAEREQLVRVINGRPTEVSTPTAGFVARLVADLAAARAEVERLSERVRELEAEVDRLSWVVFPAPEGEGQDTSYRAVDRVRHGDHRA